MLEGLIVDSFKTKNGDYGAMDDLGFRTTFKMEKKTHIYRSQAVSDLGLYTTDRNIQGAEHFFKNHMERHDKIISGNSAFYLNKPGIYHDIIYFDLKRYYGTIFSQIANHISPDYFGKWKKLSEIGRRIALKGTRTKFTKEAQKKPIVNVKDLATNAVRIDCCDNFEMIDKIKRLSEALYTDEADRRVAKITRSALCFGLGYKQKNAKIANACALTMFFAKEVLRNAIAELGQKYNVIFSHTDSFMVEHLSTKDLDDAIRTASGIVDRDYFGNTEIISLGLNHVGIKGKFEDLAIFNANSYMGSTIEPQGKRQIIMKFSGMHTTSACTMGITRNGETIQEALQEQYSDLFSLKPLEGQEKDFLYGLLNLRLSPEYEARLDTMWRDDDKRVYERAVSTSQSIRNINLHKRNLTLR
jgi:hypothetical protein